MIATNEETSIPKSKKSSQVPATITMLEQGMPQLYWDYKKLVTPSEVSDEFHLFVFMTMISALVGDKIWFYEGNDTIYPNLWTMLAGLSGKGHKSTAMNPAVKILSRINSVNLLAPKGSPEGFFSGLVDAKGVGLLRHSELGSLLGAMKKDYTGGFVEELCEYYDPCPAGLKKRLSKESDSVDHLAISWLAATTLDSLNNYDASSRIGTGFLPRWNIVFGGEPSKYIAFRPRKCPDYFDGFVQKIKSLVEPPQSLGEYRRNDEATALFESWYRRLRPKVLEGSLGYFEIRIFEVVKKYAVLLAFLWGNKNVVDKKDMSKAIEFGEYFLTTATQLITKELAENPYEKQYKNIIKTLEKAGGKASNRELMRATKLLKAHFKVVIDTMEELGMVTPAGDKMWKLCDETV